MYFKEKIKYKILIISIGNLFYHSKHQSRLHGIPTYDWAQAKHCGSNLQRVIMYIYSMSLYSIV